ncbi:TPA: hypothetical protein U2D03_001538 [Streptococcus suis]|nr:hypothetical protein [Streptococcus suis]
MEKKKKANLEIVTRLAGKVIKATVSELPHEVSEQATVEKEEGMLHHYITKYTENNQRYAESWIQINIFGRCFCLWKKRIKI